MASSRRLEAVTFEGGDGRTIAGWLDLPPDAPRAYALLAHCFSCTKDFPAVARVGRRLAERGFGVLRFDFSGHGVIGFARGRADALAAAAWLRTRHGPPRLLVGHSFGGAVLASAAAEIPEAGALATIAATADPAALRSRVCSRLRAEDEQHWELEIGGRRFAVAPELCRELEDPELLDRVARFRGAALVLHDPEDPVVPYAEAERLFSRLPQPRGLVALPGAGHLLAAPEAARHAADLIATWAEPYVGAGVQFTMQRPTPPPDRSTAEVEVLEGSVRHRQTVRIGPHVLTADEPPHLGGRDAGPSPLELLLAALGSCSTITVRMYSDRKGWPLEHVAIRCRLERGRPDEDGYGPTGHRIERVLALRGPLDPAQRKRLHEIADKCPVHKILTRSVPIRTTLA